jgi:dUTP pyrophosphatase
MKKVLISKNQQNSIIPTRGSSRAAGYDLYSTESYVLKPGERKLFKTGLIMAIPSGMYGRIAPRSGLAFKKGIDVLAGVIDEDYRGDVGVILINLGQEDFSVTTGDRIAQIIFEIYNEVEFTEAIKENDLGNTERGSSGYGSTDKKVNNLAFKLKDRVTLENFFGLDSGPKLEMARAYFANYPGDLYEFEENGFRGVCVVDGSGEILIKRPVFSLQK